MTVFALSSAPGRGGIAVIRISGRAARSTLDALCHGRLPAPRMASFRRLRHPKTAEVLDEALVLWLPGPANFTGEDMAELHVHGGRAVIAGVLDALAAAGLRLAEPGEFTRRAFGNGKIDLTEAEGLADLLNAETACQRRQALAQHCGALRGHYELWRTTLLRAMAYVEASLDFSDEEGIAENAFREALPQARGLLGELERALADGRRGEIVREGVQVAILGAPNAGKSSLLNALAGREAAIVFHEPGTTRDVIEIALDLDGFPFILRDTAGLRETESPVEREGIRRALASARDADIVLLMQDASAPRTQGAAAELLTKEEGQDEARAGKARITLTLVNKIDLAPGASPPHSALAISAKTGHGLDALKTALVRIAEEIYGSGDTPLITRARHRQEIERARSALKAFLESAAAGHETELAAEHLRDASDALGRLTGRLDVEDVLAQIFSEFCVGK
ncbi:MAG: tRNA uridine-5-carboxymethylaminomethyl(34) synthesis GTPase MnmE [Rhodomicrobium sp.]